MKHILFFLLILCGQVHAAGSVQGDVYLVVGSGDVRQGAANQVFLLPKKDTFPSEWTALCNRLKAEFELIMQQNDLLRAEHEEKIRLATNSTDIQRLRTESGSFLEADIASIMDHVITQGEEQSRWIKSLALKSSPTGMQAHYIIEASAGDYWIFAEMPLGNDKHTWLIPISITDGNNQTLDLDNTNTLPADRLFCGNQLFVN